MSFKLQHFLNEEFISNIWKKRSHVFKSALANPQDLFDRQNYLNLASQIEAQAKLISFKNNTWHIQEEDLAANFDPNQLQKFDAKLNKPGAWTLLIHHLETYFEEMERLHQEFKIFPNWCLEDIMGSYSCQDAIAPAHIDSYDVFIIQLVGSRKWSLAKNAKNEYHSDLPLRVLKEFHPEQSFEIHPGDMIYIPAGFAHEAKSLSESFSLSIGVRSLDLKSIFYEFLDTFSPQESFISPPLAQQDPAEVKQETIMSVVEQLQKDYFNPANLQKALLSQLTSELDWIDHNSVEGIKTKHPESTLVFTQSQHWTYFAIDKQVFQLPTESFLIFKQLYDQPEIELELIKDPEIKRIFLKLAASPSYF